MFFVYSDNLRHFDSYVYLTTINALAELTSWKHAQFLPKMMFLLTRLGTSTSDDSDEEGEDDSRSEYLTASNVIHTLSAAFADKNAGVSTSLRCRVQMGEALAKVAIELGALAPSYFNAMYALFIEATTTNDDALVSASALCGLANLVVACRGRCFTKNIHEVSRLMSVKQIASAVCRCFT